MFLGALYQTQTFTRLARRAESDDQDRHKSSHNSVPRAAAKRRVLDLPPGVSLAQRTRTLQLVHDLDQARMSPETTNSPRDLNTYDLAFKMQTEAPAVFDISREPQSVQDLYGIG